MEKKKVSWRVVIYLLLAAGFAALIALLLVVNRQAYDQAEQYVRQNNLSQLHTSLQENGLLLETAQGHLQELLYTLDSRQEDLSKTGTIDQITAKTDCQETMNYKIASGWGISFLYLFNSDRSLYLIRYSSTQTVPEVLAFREKLLTEELPVSSLSERTWALVHVGESAYFSLNYRLGDYVVGCLCDVAQGFETGENTYIFLQEDIPQYGLGDMAPAILQAGKLPTEEGISVVKGSLTEANVQVALITRDRALNSILSSGQISVIVVAVLFVVLLLALVIVTKTLVSRPTGQLLEAFQHIAQGDGGFRMTGKQKSREFTSLQKGFNAMADEIIHLKIDQYERQLSEKEKELVLLRSQLRPHFFLNAITTVMSMVYQGKNEEIQRYLKALSGFMRYILGRRDKTVFLEEELKGIHDYFEMQKLRFPNSVMYFAACPPSLRRMRVPYLMLLTVVENTVKHAMSLYEPLSVLIQCEPWEAPGFSGIRLTVEDNGPGFPRELLERCAAGDIPVPEEGHIGLRNIYEQLELTYGRHDLLRL